MTYNAESWTKQSGTNSLRKVLSQLLNPRCTDQCALHAVYSSTSTPHGIDCAAMIPKHLIHYSAHFCEQTILALFIICHL